MKIYQNDADIERVLNEFGTSIKECEDISGFNIYMFKEDGSGVSYLIGWKDSRPMSLQLKKALEIIQGRKL